MANKWTLSLNLAGITVRDPLAQGLPTGIYKVQVTDADLGQSDDPNKGPSVKVVATVTEGEHKGAEIFVFMGTDVSKKGVLRSWKTMLASIGAPAAALDSALTVSPESILGKNGLIYVRAKNPDEKEAYDQKDWVTADMAAKISANLAASPAPAAGANGVAGAVPQPSAPAAAAAGGGLRF